MLPSDPRNCAAPAVALPALRRRLRAEGIAGADLDLDQYYIPKGGPWLWAAGAEDGGPDSLVVALSDTPKRGRFSMVQWREHGAALDGITFVINAGGR